MIHTILNRNEDYEEIRRKTPYEVFSMWSGEGWIYKAFLMPINFIAWIYEFFRLHRSKYEFEITVWTKNREA